MGWFATKENGRPVLQHNGVLSTFYAEAVWLPKEKYGIAMLYNIQSMPATVLAYPEIKSGLIALLTSGQRPSTPWFTIKSWGLLIGVLTALTVGLGFRSLLHARQWVEEKRRRSFRRLLHVAWWLFLRVISRDAVDRPVVQRPCLWLRRTVPIDAGPDHLAEPLCGVRLGERGRTDRPLDPDAGFSRQRH
jgi:hypothetical protein